MGKAGAEGHVWERELVCTACCLDVTAKGGGRKGPWKSQSPKSCDSRHKETPLKELDGQVRDRGRTYPGLGAAVPASAAAPLALLQARSEEPPRGASQQPAAASVQAGVDGDDGWV